MDFRRLKVVDFQIFSVIRFEIHHTFYSQLKIKCGVKIIKLFLKACEDNFSRPFVLDNFTDQDGTLNTEKRIYIYFQKVPLFYHVSNARSHINHIITFLVLKHQNIAISSSTIIIFSRTCILKNKNCFI